MRGVSGGRGRGLSRFGIVYGNAKIGAKCPDLDSMGWWAKLLYEALNSEMELHRGFCAGQGYHPAVVDEEQAVLAHEVAEAFE